MKVITYNINGLRGAVKKGLNEWLSKISPDIICLQEVRIKDELIDYESFKLLGYQFLHKPSNKPGYSGVAILSKQNPIEVINESQLFPNHNEGRIIAAVFQNQTFVSVYVPSAGNIERLSYKLNWLEELQEFINYLKEKYKRPLIIGGDFNIAHQAIDLFNPLDNLLTAGFLQVERDWFTKCLESGFIDAFRAINPEGDQYTWFSYRNKAKDRNLGWRLDYLLVSEEIIDQINRCVILKHANYSDHCPVLLEIAD